MCSDCCCCESDSVSVMGSSNRVEDFDRSDEEKYGKKRDYDPEFRGPIKSRSCTDVLCLLLLLVFVGGWAAVSVYGFQNGDPERLIYPSNSRGEICGRGDYLYKPYLIFFDISQCASLTSFTSGCPTPQVCVERCPTEYEFPYGLNTDDEKEKMRPWCTDEKKVNDSNYNMDRLITEGICPPYLVPSKSYLKRCLPSLVEDPSGNDLTNETVIVDGGDMPDGESILAGDIQDAMGYVAKLMNGRGVAEKAFADIRDSGWFILVGLIIGMVLAFVWIILMRFVAAVMIWTSLVLSVALLTLSCVYCYFKYDSLKSDPESQASITEIGFTTDLSAYTELANFWLTFFIMSVVALVVILLILIFLRKRIRIAIELIEEGSIAVGDIMSTLFFPVVPFLLQLVVIAFFTIVAMFLASSGEPNYVLPVDPGDGSCPKENDEIDVTCKTDNGTYYVPSDVQTAEDFPNCECMFLSYGIANYVIYMHLFNLFMLLWGLFFLSALEELVMAGAFAAWYWTFNKKDLPAAPLSLSAWRAFRYHLGTLAFGSLIIAIIRFIRIMIEFVEERLKEYSQDNPIVKCMLWTCKCCLWCLEKFMRFLNRNAYIMTAIYGKNFCWSAKESFFLLLRNAARVFVLDKVTDFLLLLGKLVVVGAVGVLSFYFFSGRLTDIDATDLNYYFVPIIIVVVGTYFIADVFFDVYEMAVDTLFLCFLEDLERNDGTPLKPYYMSKDLRAILNVKNSRSSTPKKED